VLTAVVMTTSVMISYTRSRAENVIPTCKVGFLERPERVVLLIIGGLMDRMAPVLGDRRVGDDHGGPPHGLHFRGGEATGKNVLAFEQYPGQSQL